MSPSTGQNEQQHGTNIYSSMPQDNWEFQALISGATETEEERECP
jgi:hypothetical protein